MIMIDKSRELIVLKPTPEYLRSKYRVLKALLNSKSIPYFQLSSFDKFLEENLLVSESELPENRKRKYVFNL